MRGLVWGAILARRVQLATVLLLTSVAVAAAVAGPWYVLAAAESSAAATVATAPAEFRTVSVTTQPLALSGPPDSALSGFRAAVDRSLAIPGLVPVLGLLQGGQVTPPSGALTPVPIAYRDGVCAHLTITGGCPRRDGEALLSRRGADQLGLRIGADARVAPQPLNPPITLHVVGLYDVADPSSTYWAGTPFTIDNPIFVPLTMFGRDGLDRPKAVYDAEVPAAAIRGTGGVDLTARLARADYDLSTSGRALNSRVPGLAGAVAADRRTIQVGVLVGAAELLALCWFALYLSGRYTARERRADVAVLKLHGARPGRVVRMVAGQALAPTLAGLLLGLGAGALLVRAIAGPVRDPAWMRLGWRVSAAGAGLAVLGALAALTLADLRTLRTGVAELLRQVPPRRQRGRSAAREAGGRAPGARVHGAIGELLVLAVAAAAVYQARAQAGAGYEVPGLAALAPALVAVAVAVVAGRLLGYLATGIGSRALDAGRLRLALGALQISRRPGTERVFALVAVSVALLATAANGWAVSSAARSTRVVVDLGADRILTVRADSPTALLTAVRAADPAGREAMAVVVSSRGVIGTTILAVDSQRLARVARWRPEYPPLDRVLAALRGAAPAPALFAAGTLTLDATGAPVPPTYVVAKLENQRTGAVDQVRFGPLSGSRQTYRADVAGCADPPGCRLVSLGLAGPPDRLGQPTQVVPGESAIVEGLAGAGTVAGADLLGDARRWRPAGAGVGLGLVIAPGDGRLRLTADGTTQHGPNPDFQAYLVDGPVPLPAVLAGDPPADWAIGQAYVSLLGADLVPVRVTATANVLPMVGQRGVLVDLAGARRLATGSGAGDVQQVWLAPGAGARVVERLRANRVQVVGDDSAAKYRARLDVQGPAAVARFAVVAASIGLLLAAGTVAVVGAVEREPRARELASLRAQGLRAPDVRAVGYVGYAATAGAAVLAGLLASLVARLLVDAAQPVFADSWSVLPTSTAPQVAALLATAAAAVAVVGFAAWLAGRQLVRAVTSAAGARLRRGQTGREAPWSR